MLKLFDSDIAIGDVTVNKGCLLANEFIIVVENTAWLLRAAASSFNVLRDAGAESIKLFIAVVS